MKADKIFEKLCEFAPIELAMNFDNAGFLLGDKNAEVKKAVVCLDATSSSVDFAIENGANLIISHHPIIYNPLKDITAQTNSRVYKCLATGISVISMHTNMDVAESGVNDCLANKLLLKNIAKIVDEEGFAFRKGELEEPMSAEIFARFVKERLGGVLRYTDSGKEISTVAVVGGSGGDFWKLARACGADALVTADVKHSYFIDASENGFSLFDAGHFHTENVVVQPLCDRLIKEIPEVEFIAYNGKEIKTV